MSIEVAMSIYVELILVKSETVCIYSVLKVINSVTACFLKECIACGILLNISILVKYNCNRKFNPFLIMYQTFLA